MSAVAPRLQPDARQRIWSLRHDRATVEQTAADMRETVQQFQRRQPFFVVVGPSNPDRPGYCLARLYFADQPPYEATNYVLASPTLHGLHEQLPRGLQLSPRMPGDHAQLLEVWV